MNKLYRFNQPVELSKVLLLGIQFLIPNGLSLVFVVLIAQQIKISAIEVASLLSVTLMASAITTLIQAQTRWKFIGGGMYLPLSAAPVYIAPSIMAVKMGGLPLLFGMTLVAGLLHILFSFVIRYVKVFFPSEIAGLVLCFIGVDLMVLGIEQYQQVYHAPHLVGLHSVLFYMLQALPLLMVIAFEQWGQGWIKLYGFILACVVGYLLIFCFGYMAPTGTQHIAHGAWFFIPSFAPGGYQFKWSLLLPFSLGAIICAIKMSGVISGLQALQDDPAVANDFKQIARGNMTDALGSVFSGLMGGMGLNASSSGVAMSMNTKMTSRYIAYVSSPLLLLAAFCPKVELIFYYMPKAVSAAILMGLSTALAISGLKMMLQYSTQLYQKLTIALALVFGFSYGIYPTIYQHLPHALQSITVSAIVMAALVAIILNAFFVIVRHILRRVGYHL